MAGGSGGSSAPGGCGVEPGPSYVVSSLGHSFTANLWTGMNMFGNVGECLFGGTVFRAGS